MENKFFIRHPEEALMINRAFALSLNALDMILDDLCSANSQRCKVLQETLRDLNDPVIWDHLLFYLANHCWDDQLHRYWQSDPVVREKFDQAIVEVLVQDENDREGAIKDTVLREGLVSPKYLLRYSAAYLLGLRCDPGSIPVLSEIIDHGSKNWKLRSVKALSKISNKDCAVPLMKALISDRGKLHREARRALQNLGSMAESVWSEALNHADSHIRWEAAHGLGQIGDSRAVLTLAEGLLDENYVVRWTTANVLSQIGEKGVQATLTILLKNDMNEPLRRSAFHTLNNVTSPKIREKINPLIDALLKSSSRESPYRIAKSLLLSWEKVE